MGLMDVVLFCRYWKANISKKKKKCVENLRGVKRPKGTSRVGGREVKINV